MAGRHFRSALFVPGSRPERFEKALATGADCVIVDFEDAVEEELKAQARENLRSFLAANRHVRVIVRVNAIGHPQHDADLALCRQLDRVQGVMLPKAEIRASAKAVSACAKAVWPLIETARGAREIQAIAALPGVERMTFGALDLGLELGVKAGALAAEKILDQVRYSLLLASAEYGLARPLDTVFPDISNASGLKAMASNGRDMGFCGMLCIHPSQVSVANDVYAPTLEELAWARKVVEAAGATQAGAFRLDGRMVDAPVIRQARQLIESLAGN